MKATITTIILFVVTMSAFSQRANEFQIRAGYGLAVYSTDITFGYDFAGIRFESDTTDGAATAHFPIEFRYEFTERINAGIDLKFGNYLYSDEDQGTGKSNRFSIVGIGGEVVLFNADNARLYLGLGINTGRLNMYENNGLFSSESVWQGGGYKLTGGFMFFFGDSPLGVNLNLNYDQHNFKLTDFKVNDSSQDISDVSGTLKVGGIEANAGIVLRIR